MNINELTNSIYSSEAGSVSGIKKAEDILKENVISESEKETVKDFAEILSSCIQNNNDDDNNSNVMNILLDAQTSKEYLESKSGRNLIISMAENSISSIITGNNDNDN